MWNGSTTADPTAVKTNFCKICSTLLETPDSDQVICSCCGHVCTYGDFVAANLVVESESTPRTDPAWVLANIKKARGEDDEDGNERAIVDEDCPKCGHTQASFYTMQLRSVDEGQTVFYKCLKCGNKWSQNN